MESGYEETEERMTACEGEDLAHEESKARRQALPLHEPCGDALFDRERSAGLRLLPAS